MDRRVGSRSGSTARDEDAASVTSNSATQGSTLNNERGLNARNIETNTQDGVDLFKNSKVTTSREKSPVLVHQLQRIFATCVTAMQAENPKLASNLESNLNKFSDNLDVKLALVSDNLDAKLNMVSDILDEKFNDYKYKIKQEFTIQLQTEVQLIAKELEVVSNSTERELTNCLRNLETECNKINDSIKHCRLQIDASMNSLRSMVNQNMEEVENKIGNLTHNIRSVASVMKESNSSMQMDKRNCQLEIQRLESQIENFRTNVMISLHCTMNQLFASPYRLVQPLV